MPSVGHGLIVALHCPFRAREKGMLYGCDKYREPSSQESAGSQTPGRLGVARSGYYAWLHNPISSRARKTLACDSEAFLISRKLRAQEMAAQSPGAFGDSLAPK